MTLLEILLTLCLLVILASLTWPALGRPMARQRLRASADQVRVEWVRARVEAMSSGRTCEFRYSFNGDGYSIEAYSSEDDVASEAMLAGPDAFGQEAEQPADSRSQHRRLAEKIRFVADQTSGQTAAQSPSLGARPAGFGSQSPASGAGQSAAADASPAPPIFFYADGTCSDAQVGLENEYGHTVTLSLRGLTGVVTVSEVLSAEARGR